MLVRLSARSRKVGLKPPSWKRYNMDLICRFLPNLKSLATALWCLDKAMRFHSVQYCHVSMKGISESSADNSLKMIFFFPLTVLHIF